MNKTKMTKTAALELAVHLGMELYPMDIEKRKAFVERKKAELLKERR